MKNTTTPDWRGRIIKTALDALPGQPLHEPTTTCNGRVKYAEGSWVGRPVDKPIIKVGCGCDWRMI